MVTFDKNSGTGTPTKPVNVGIKVAFEPNNTGGPLVHNIYVDIPFKKDPVLIQYVQEGSLIEFGYEQINYDHNNNQVPFLGGEKTLWLFGKSDFKLEYAGTEAATAGMKLSAIGGNFSGPQDLGELNISDQSVYIYKGEEIPYIHNKTMKVSDFEKEGYMNAVNGVLYASDLYKYKVFFVPAGTSFSYSGRNATMNAALLVFHNLNKSLDANINDGILPYDSTTKIHDVTIENAHISGNYSVTVDTFLFVNKQIANVNDIVFSNVVIGGKKQSLRLDSLIEEDPDESEQTTDEESE